MSGNKRGSNGEHLASFEDAFGDGEATYWKEVDERQKNHRSRRCSRKKTLRQRIEEAPKLPKKVTVRSEKRDQTAAKIREAKTHEEKMAIAAEHHKSVLNPDPYVFPKKWQRDVLARQNRTALKFKEEKTK